MEKTNYLVELFKINFIENKAWCALALFAGAFMILIGDFRDWDWIFKPTNLTYRYGIINSFGRKTGRVFAALCSLFIMAFAVAWIVYCSYKTPFRW